MALEKEGRKEEEKLEPDPPRGITLEGGPEPSPYRYAVAIPAHQERSIEEYRAQYSKFLKLHNNTDNAKLWDVYDHITDDLFEELYREATRDMDQKLDSYLEALIKSEFR